MDPASSLKKAENSIRDVIHYILTNSLGSDWHNRCGVSPDRVSKWEEKRAEEQKRTGRSDPRLIYYSDFYDLKTIIKKSWDNGLKEVFEKLKGIENLLDLLDENRNPIAHQRELLPYQKHIVEGVSGKIRSQITGYFCKMETGDAYYPRIEFIQDNLGTSWSAGSKNVVPHGPILRPGDLLQFVVTATDPLGEQLTYILCPEGLVRDKVENFTGEFEFEVLPKHVQQRMSIHLIVRSPREFHALAKGYYGDPLHGADHVVTFFYEVLPPLS